MWNSEKYNMSWTSDKTKGATSLPNKSRTGIGYLAGREKRMPRDVINPFNISYIPQQWNNSYSSFVNQINTKTWKVQGETIAIRNLSVVQVPALIIEVRISCFLFIFFFHNVLALFSYAVGKAGRQRSGSRGLPFHSGLQRQRFGQERFENGLVQRRPSSGRFLCSCTQHVHLHSPETGPSWIFHVLFRGETGVVS
jgi:hypothetical protein